MIGWLQTTTYPSVRRHEDNDLGLVQWLHHWSTIDFLCRPNNLVLVLEAWLIWVWLVPPSHCILACLYVSRLLTHMGSVHPAYNPSFSACFFSRNSIFLSQQISQQCFPVGLSAQPNGAMIQSWIGHESKDKCGCVKRVISSSLSPNIILNSVLEGAMYFNERYRKAR
jgi:hypothetical protein